MAGCLDGVGGVGRGGGLSPPVSNSNQVVVGLVLPYKYRDALRRAGKSRGP